MKGQVQWQTGWTFECTAFCHCQAAINVSRSLDDVWFERMLVYPSRGNLHWIAFIQLQIILLRSTGRCEEQGQCLPTDGHSYCRNRGSVCQKSCAKLVRRYCRGSWCCVFVNKTIFCVKSVELLLETWRRCRARKMGRTTRRDWGIRTLWWVCEIVYENFLFSRKLPTLIALTVQY